MIAGAEAADGANALGERADDEVDLVFELGLVRKAPAIRAKHAEGMGLIDQELESMLPLDGDEIGERGAVAHHRIDAFEDDEPTALVFRPRQALVEIARIIVAEPHELGTRQRAAVIDR